jgi:hypothetical protein
MRTIRVANGAGFLGDWIDAPRRLLERAEVDYLTIEHLAELTMSILARAREKDPTAGYAEDFLEVLRSIAPKISRQPKLRVIANSGGVNPQACARAAGQLLSQHGLQRLPVACLSGDDLLPQLDELVAQGEMFHHLDAGEPITALVERLADADSRAGDTTGNSRLAQHIVAANAYLGAGPIADALSQQARVVITGRVADASLTLGPALHEFGWPKDAWDLLAGGTVAGHLIECGAQVTGGYGVDWAQYELADVGYPIAELASDGSSIITKPAGTGGAVTRRTVVEQLVYEIGDPAHYLTPDVDCDFTTVDVQQAGSDRVAVRGATGRPATDNYKVSLAYRDGWMASGTLLVYGADCREKAEACGRIILERCHLAGLAPARTQVELLGAGAGVPGSFFHRKYQPPGEVVLRVTASDPRRAAIESFARQFAPLITSGPAGLAGYAAGRPQVRPVFAYWPTLIAKERVQPRLEVKSAGEWAA